MSANMGNFIEFENYPEWVSSYDAPNNEDRAAIKTASLACSSPPIFSVILLPSRDGDIAAAHLSLTSVREQLYPHWELLIRGGIIEGAIQERDKRIVGVEISNNDIMTSFNAALAKSSGDFVLPLPEGVILSETALYELGIASRPPHNIDIFFSDEDEITSDGSRQLPRFKTAWDPETALAYDGTGLLVAYRRGLLDHIGGMLSDSRYLTTALLELSLAATSASSPTKIRHLAAILCHRPPNLRSFLLSEELEERRVIVRRYLRGNGIEATIEPAPLAPQFDRVRYPLPNPLPLVSVIIPTRDHADLLERCVIGLLSRTDYPSIEILVVDNGSETPDALALLATLAKTPCVQVLNCPIPFNFARLNNIAAGKARGEILLLLNNDTDVISSNWLREMVSHSVRPDVGAVGAKLIYQDGRIQHAGIVLGPEFAVTHQLRYAERLDPGPLGELAICRSVSAVTGACMAIRRTVFFEVGGLNEDMKIAYNDIDLCLRLGDHGYRIVWTPFAELYHLECATRGYDSESEDRRALAKQEQSFFVRFWRDRLQTDPFHNPNITYGPFTTKLATPPRCARPWANAGGNFKAIELQLPEVRFSDDFPSNVLWDAATSRDRVASLLRSIDDARSEVYRANLRVEIAEAPIDRVEIQMQQAQKEAEHLRLIARQAQIAEQHADLTARHAMNEARDARMERDQLLASSTVQLAMLAGRLASRLPNPVRRSLVKGLALARKALRP